MRARASASVGGLGGDAQLALPLLGVGGQGGVGHGVHLLPELVFHLRLPDAEELERPGDDGPVGQRAEIGRRPVAEHGGALPGRAGEHEDVDALRFKRAAGCGPPVVLKDGGTLREVELLGVVGRHLPADFLEEGPAAGLGLRVMDQLFSKARGQYIFRQVVAGGAQPPRGDNQVGPGFGQFHRRPQPPGVVPHHGVVIDVDPQGGEPLGEHLCVGIGDVAEEQLGAHGDELRSMGHGNALPFL